MKKKAGFSLIEVLISVVIILLLVAVGAPVGLNFYLDYEFDSEYNLLFSLLRYSRNLAMVNYNESAHGLYIENEEFTIFQGASYAVRTVAQDRSFKRSNAINIAGPSEILFSALSGQTASSTYAVSDSRKSRDIYVNPEGLVYEP